MSASHEFIFDIIDPTEIWGYENDDAEVCLTVDSSKIFEEGSTLSYVIDYPLTNTAEFTHAHHDGTGWTIGQFAAQLALDYEEIYAAKGNPYGIWGHDIGDLVFEGATRLEDGSWDFNIGS